MSAAIWTRFRPYLEKVGQLHPRRWGGFIGDLVRSTPSPWWVWLPKVPWCLMRGFNYHEFRFYGIHGKSWRTIATFHSTIENVKFVEAANAENQLPLLRDKAQFLERFKHRLGREFLDLRKASEGDLVAFIERHPRFITKAYNLAMGAGIEVFDGTVQPPEIPALFARLRDEGKYVVEAFLSQHPEVNKIYSSSINSIRLYTYRLPDREAELVFPAMMRFGSGGGRIDADGELTVLLDPKSGQCVAGAVNIERQWFKKHPDSGVEFLSMVIPGLPEAVALVEAAARELPELTYVGWDVAMTPDGPVLIEGNGAPILSTLQLLMSEVHPEGHGCRALISGLTRA
jgi:hypothetical protein